jgi:drug/metabolite transporter (DMT)-like permease
MQTSSTAARSQTARGILLMCAGVAFLCVNDVIGKTLVAGYSPVQILFLRNVIALPIAILIALRMGGTAALRSYRPMAHLVRGMIWLGAATTFFTGLSYLGLAEATTLIFVAPIVVTALSALVLKEQVGWRRWTAVVIGFVGVLVVVRPGSSAFQPASLFPVATAFLYAALMISARWVDARESVWTLMLYLVGAGALLSGFIAPFFWTPIRAEDIWLFVGIALFGTGGMTMMTQAFRFAPASILAPLDYTSLVWATAFGWLIWSELPDLATYAGAAIIVGSGVFIVWRERRVGKG